MEVEVRRVASGEVGLVALPPHLIYILQQRDAHNSVLVVLELVLSRPAAGDGVALLPWFLAWNGATSSSICIEVSESLAECIGLPDRSKVTVRVRIDLPEAQTVLVEPATEDDSEILELHADYLESHILNEIIVLQEGRRFPVSIPGQGTIVLLAKSTTPRSVVKLTQGTELVVSVKRRQPKGNQTQLSGKRIWLRILNIDPSLHQVFDLGGKRLVVVPTAAIYLSSSSATRVSLTNGQWVLLTGCQSTPSNEQDDASRSAVVRVIFWDAAPEGHAMLSTALRKYLDVKLHGGLCLQSFQQSNVQRATSGRISPLVFHSEKVANSDKINLKDVIPDGLWDKTLKAWMEAHEKAFLEAPDIAMRSWPTVSVISISEESEEDNRLRKDSIFLLRLQCAGNMDDKQFIVDASVLRQNRPNDTPLDVQIERPQYVPSSPEEQREVKLPSFESVWVKGRAGEALQRLTLLLTPTCRQKLRTFKVPTPIGVLLHGPGACGKTQLALALARNLGENKQIQAHWSRIKCAELSGEPEASVRQRLKATILDAIHRAPSLVVLDDLDTLFPVSDERPADVSVTSLAEYLADMMDDAQKVASMAFLATASRSDSLPVSLRSSGRFDYSIELEPPGLRERGGILKEIIASRGFDCPDAVTSSIAAKCDGYDANDLEIVVDRAMHASAARCLGKNVLKGATDKLHLTEDDLNDARQGFVPSALKGVARAGKNGPKLGWEDIGGLPEVCRVIRELLELPVKFPKLFASPPSRLRTGVLLYGPPGCGKTHIVAAAAAACSLRYIPVKGPELLDKYIAPKRGHDNTGVTDRVVNQLLAELDGVSAITGVFTFAATNRPDLIDAALLRPGRLDHLLFCDFPSQPERLDILRVLSRHLSMENDVDLHRLSRLSEGFSGADLKAVLSDAELDAVHLALDGPKQDEKTRPVITMDMLMSALAKAIPLQETERRRFANIYNTFASGRSSSKESKGKKATLA